MSDDLLLPCRHTTAPTRSSKWAHILWKRWLERAASRKRMHRGYLVTWPKDDSSRCVCWQAISIYRYRSSNVSNGPKPGIVLTYERSKRFRIGRPQNTHVCCTYPPDLTHTTLCLQVAGLPLAVAIPFKHSIVVWPLLVSLYNPLPAPIGNATTSQHLPHCFPQRCLPSPNVPVVLPYAGLLALHADRPFVHPPRRAESHMAAIRSGVDRW